MLLTVNMVITYTLRLIKEEIETVIHTHTHTVGGQTCD